MAITLVTARKLVLLAALVALAAPAAVFAAGDHAGGHGHADADTAIGKPGVTGNVDRTIAIAMSDDMRFTPSELGVRQGETVRFVVTNTGKVKHEFVLGTRKTLLEHLEAMRKSPDMMHDEPGKLTLDPGARGEIVWQFTRAGTVDFACLLPGHYEAGMKGEIKVGKSATAH